MKRSPEEAFNQGYGFDLVGGVPESIRPDHMITVVWETRDGPYPYPGDFMYPRAYACDIDALTHCFWCKLPDAKTRLEKMSVADFLDESKTHYECNPFEKIEAVFNYMKYAKKCHENKWTVPKKRIEA